MKRLTVFLMILAISLTSLISCESNKEKEYTLHLGVTTSVNEGSGKVSETVAAVVTDSDGKIVQCRIDVIEFEAKIDNRGDPIASKPLTKHEQGDDYGMDKNPYVENTAGEWYKQAEYFEKFVEGMTLGEVKEIAFLESGKPADTDLVAGCTIAATDLKDAVVKALEGTNKYTFSAKGEITSAVSAIGTTEISYAKSGEAEDPTKPIFAFQTDFAAVVSAKGRVASAAIDSIEVKLEYTVSEENTLVLEGVTDRGTKFELGDSYGMAIYDPENTAGEWYKQAEAVAKGAVGYETKKLSVYSEDLVAGCTMYAGGYKAALTKAADSVR